MYAMHRNGYIIGVYGGMGGPVLKKFFLTSILRCHLLRNDQDVPSACIYPTALRRTIVQKTAAAVYVTMRMDETN